MASQSAHQNKRTASCGQRLVGCCLTSLLLVTTLTASPVKDCQDYLKDAVNVHNCSGRDLAKIPDDLSDKADILDFSLNKFNVLPYIPESSECNETCPSHNYTVHCRQGVSFSRNQITSLTTDAFHGLKCLRTLDLSFNELRSNIFNSTTFDEGLFYLHRLLLNNNPLGTLPANAILQPFLPHLRELDLSHCDLDTIDPNAVDDFGELTILNLSFNKLKSIPADTFKGLNNLEHLDLRENQLEYLPEHIFGDLVSLKVLLLSDNKITGFHEKAFYRDSSLQTLDLRNNRLTSVPYTALDKLTKLRSLDLSQNPIKQVVRGPTLTGVQSLVLDNMPELTELGPYSLSSFQALVSLSISGNKGLEVIDRKFRGDNMMLLKLIRLENNKLSTLDEDTLPWKQLKELTLGGNPWFCDDTLKWVIKASATKGDITCSGPLQLKGHNLKTLNPDDLMRDYSLQSATGVIVLCVCLPVFAVCAILVWQRRRHFPCVKVTLKGKYVTLFTRDIDEDGEQRMAVAVKVNAGKLDAVSNGRADDTSPFIRVHNKSLKEEFEADVF